MDRLRAGLMLEHSSAWAAEFESCTRCTFELAREGEGVDCSAACVACGLGGGEQVAEALALVEGLLLAGTSTEGDGVAEPSTLIPA